MTSFINAMNKLAQAISERNKIMSELTDALGSINSQLATISEQQTKGYDEITTLINDLKATTPDNTEALALADQIQAKVDTLAGQTQQLDDVVPDATP